MPRSSPALILGLALVIGLPSHVLGDISVAAPADLTWETTAEGVAFAPLQGDRFTAPYQAMVRLPAGTVSPLHFKTANMFGLMVQGTMTHVAPDQDPARAHPVGPGTYYMIPAGQAHVSSCISATPCLTFLYQDGPFDFVPVPK